MFSYLDIQWLNVYSYYSYQERTFHGCSHLRTCKRMEKPPNSCRFDIPAECGVLGAGDNCTLGCQIPFAGPRELVVCPEDNIDPYAYPSYRLPDCQPECPTPEPENMRGYARLGPWEWRCAEGWIGTAEANCTIDEDYSIL